MNVPPITAEFVIQYQGSAQIIYMARLVSVRHREGYWDTLSYEAT
jgi:hypothetical protein